MSSVYAIGDVHGELDKLKNLFSKLDLQKEDTIIFLGDYIDRGPDSKGVIDFIIDLKSKYNVVTLKGNHETFALEFFKYLRGEPYLENYIRSWMSNGGAKCLLSYDHSEEAIVAAKRMYEEHHDFLEGLQLTYETETHIFVHGCLEYDKNSDDQDETNCLWGRFYDIAPHKSGKIVVCGHTIYGEVKDCVFKVCIDTGSFKPDGFITAMHIQGNQTQFIDSK